ncbi:hypothetical protein WISP_149391 [Willisornis vidua]|uniref:SN protein n=1 Tax=Willisornis vidua TaxID=1566151 RepID=A0ABQ9CL02_9PASS|nr:hypothetical protein WISP_149391 [Willisornis vidua]
MGGTHAVLVAVDAPQEPTFISLVDPRGGRQAVLLCSVDSSPPSDIALSRGPGQPPLASTRGPSDPRLDVRAAPNSLRVALAGLALRDTGLYLCSANNSRGAAASSLRLDVGGVTVTAEPSPEVPEGTSATMTCSVTPWWGEGANYTWYRDGRWLRDGPSPSLVLPRVSSADSGSYRCRASGAWGTASSAPLGLSVLYPPRDVSVSTFLENRSGRVGIVLCTADSHPPSTMALLHQGRLVASSLAPAAAPGVRVAPSHNALRVELGALGTGAAGRYLCVATNSLGNATASAHFDVNTLTHLQTFTILAGLLLALICVATLGLLAVKMWPRIRRFQGWSGAEDTLELRSKQEPMQDIPGTSAVSPGSSKECAPDTESPSGTGEADYCRRILVRDAKGTIREIVLPKGLDLDRPKRTRTSFTAEQLYRLELEFQRCQYVVGRERTELARQLNLSETQEFNARLRFK